MEQEEVRDHRVERPVSERQRLGAAVAELELADDRRRAIASIASAMSTPTTDAPRSAAAAATKPGPEATSSTRAPLPTRGGVEQRLDDTRRDPAEESS